MKRITVALIAALALMAAAPAAAHQLRISKAERIADRVAGQLADRVDGAYDSQVDECYRLSAHTVDCTIIIYISDESGDFECTDTVRVRYKSPRSRGTKISFPGEPDCG